MRFRLRTLHLLVLLSGLGIGTFLPAREWYVHRQWVAAVYREVDASLAFSTALSGDNPELALYELSDLRELLAGMPMFSDAERAELVAKLDAQIARTREDLERLNRRLEAYERSCGIDLTRIEAR